MKRYTQMFEYLLLESLVNTWHHLSFVAFHFISLMKFRTSKLWLKSIQVLTVLISYLSKKKCQWKIANPKHQDYVEIIPPFFESSTKICVPFLGDILSSLFVHSYQTRFFLMSGIWYLRFVFVCICRKTLKDKQQDANCLQIDLLVWFYLQNYVSVEMIWYITCPFTFPHFLWAHEQITMTSKPNVRDLFYPFLRGSS